MEIQEALKWTDDLVFAKTGKHLDSLQQAVLKGVWECRGYKEIADNYHCSADHIRKTAFELWKLLSEILGEKVKKSNVRAIFDKVEFSKIANLSFGDEPVNIMGSVNFCGKDGGYLQATNNPSPDPNSTSNIPKQRHDLREAPEPDILYNRTSEITTLKRWILEEKIRIVTIFGLSGIGKTVVARELVEQIQDNFEYILWRNSTNTLTLQCLKTNLMELFSKNRESKFDSLIDYLRTHSCLIVLDDFQELFAERKLAGTYLPNCENYRKFWQQIARLPHNSCFLLLSWENPTEIATLASENRHCRTLQLGGLGEEGAKIFTDKGLKDEQRWWELIKLCNGNPSWLKIIASTILDLFNGSVQSFLSYPALFPGDLESKLESHYQRLSESEKMVMLWLANQNGADISDKPVELALSEYDFLKAVHSLRKRAMLETVTDQVGSLLAVPALLKDYVKDIAVDS